MGEMNVDVKIVTQGTTHTGIWLRIMYLIQNKTFTTQYKLTILVPSIKSDIFKHQIWKTNSFIIHY